MYEKQQSFCKCLLIATDVHLEIYLVNFSIIYKQQCWCDCASAVFCVHILWPTRGGCGLPWRLVWTLVPTDFYFCFSYLPPCFPVTSSYPYYSDVSITEALAHSTSMYLKTLNRRTGLLAKNQTLSFPVSKAQRKWTFHKRKHALPEIQTRHSLNTNNTILKLNRIGQYVYMCVLKEDVKCRPQITFHINHSEPLCSR